MLCQQGLMCKTSQKYNVHRKRSLENNCDRLNVLKWGMSDRSIDALQRYQFGVLSQEHQSYAKEKAFFQLCFNWLISICSFLLNNIRLVLLDNCQFVLAMFNEHCQWLFLCLLFDFFPSTLILFTHFIVLTISELCTLDLHFILHRLVLFSLIINNDSLFLFNVQ